MYNLGFKWPVWARVTIRCVRTRGLGWARSRSMTGGWAKFSEVSDCGPVSVCGPDGVKDGVDCGCELVGREGESIQHIIRIPTKAYYDVEEVKENATQKSQKIFVHVPSEIAAYEVEKIDMTVEHLLQDVKDITINTLATEVTGKLTALKGFDYLDPIIDEKLPLNSEILYHLQDVFNLLLNFNVTELIKAFAVKTNDMMLVIYLSSLIQSVIALYNLINNKRLNKEHEKAKDAKPTRTPAVNGS
ncbi:26S proteasome non-ATPase regulatory subunit 7 homolog A-like [Hevea brasiliensis]|uniref:26S proteasome non-ATPase regulatory subunit 7 homolog A-like n=1 Tax=Hevea brasiliensis TaxID=3981 RepID=UPI0025D8D27E|nr:26S proteasome non-ATPase regulatory subunit 7 homolog A-like [Hevea brasiliensis]